MCINNVTLIVNITKEISMATYIPRKLYLFTNVIRLMSSLHLGIRIFSERNVKCFPATGKK